MKRVKILVLMLCFVFAFSSFGSFAEVAMILLPAANDSAVVTSVSNETEKEAIGVDQPVQTVQNVAYEQKELEDLLKIDDFANIENEQNTVTKSAYKFKNLNKTNVCAALLMINRYLQSREGYYKAELIKIKLITQYKKKVVAQKAIQKLEKRFAAQRAIDEKIFTKLIELKKYIVANESKLSVKQKQIIKAYFQPTIAKYFKHKLTLQNIQNELQKAKVALIGKTVDNKGKFTEKIKQVKQSIKGKKEVIQSKKEGIKSKIKEKIKGKSK